MSDLHCPATLVVARPAEGRTQALGLADALEGRRVAAVWCSDASRAVHTAEIAAARLGVGVTVRKALREAGVDDGESGHEVVARHRIQLEEIADLHRGETVLVIGHQQALEIVVPSLAGHAPSARAQRRELENDETVELENDADGWVLRRWGDQRF